MRPFVILAGSIAPGVSYFKRRRPGVWVSTFIFDWISCSVIRTRMLICCKSCPLFVVNVVS